VALAVVPQNVGRPPDLLKANPLTRVDDVIQTANEVIEKIKNRFLKGERLLKLE
jgi:hypothetical protein